jgi:hypothetical protein
MEGAAVWPRPRTLPSSWRSARDREMTEQVIARLRCNALWGNVAQFGPTGWL